MDGDVMSVDGVLPMSRPDVPQRLSQYIQGLIRWFLLPTELRNRKAGTRVDGAPRWCRIC